MITRTVNVKLPKNLSASPVALLVQKASKFDSIIYIEAGERKVNAKSIMGIFSLDLNKPITLGIHNEEDIDHILEVLSPYIEETEE